ncbi:MAG: ArsR/SmtB family transcription factor [Oscillospiraceae bacterium]
MTCKEENPEKSIKQTEITDNTLSKVNDNMPPDEILYDLAELFKIFGDSTRIKILYALFESELCVNDISKLLGITQTAVSHQLRVLKTNKLVRFRKEGKNVFYSLSDDHVRSIIEMGMEHVEE